MVSILRQPDYSFGATEKSDFRFEERKSLANDVIYDYVVKDGVGKVTVYPSGSPVKYLKLRFEGDMSKAESVYSDQWERGSEGAYFEWSSIMPHKPLPWFCYVKTNKGFVCYGVKTGPNCLAHWQVDVRGVTLFMNLMNGGDGTDLIIEGGYVYARAMNNDGIDGNGNVYVKGGLVYAIGSREPEVAIDANTEENKKLYVQGGTVIAIGGLERGASITGGTCKYTSSWTENTWHALYNGGELVAAFQTPTKASGSNNPGGSGPGGNRPPGGGGPSGGGGSQQLVVYTSSTPSMTSDVTVNGGTEYFGGVANIGGTVSGGTSVTLSNYSSSGR